MHESVRTHRKYDAQRERHKEKQPVNEQGVMSDAILDRVVRGMLSVVILE